MPEDNIKSYLHSTQSLWLYTLIDIAFTQIRKPHYTRLEIDYLGSHHRHPYCSVAG